MAEKDRIRTDKFSVYLLPEERQLLEKQAYEFNLSKADYIRKLILADALMGSRWTMDREQGKQMLLELNQIANSLRQIEYNTNAKQYADHDDWRDVVHGYYECLELVARLAHMDNDNIDIWKMEAVEMIRKRIENGEPYFDPC